MWTLVYGDVTLVVCDMRVVRTKRLKDTSQVSLPKCKTFNISPFVVVSEATENY